MALGQVKARHQGRAWLVRLADDGNHLVNIEQNNLPPLKDMNPVQHLAQTVARAPLNGGVPERYPLLQHLAQRLLHRLAIQANHGQVNGGRSFQTGVRQQGGNEFLLLCAAAFGLKHQAHGGVFIRLVAHHIQHRQHAGFELGLLLRQGFFAGFYLGVGEFFNLLQHALVAYARR